MRTGTSLGFPSYWNVVTFYLFFLALPPAAATAILLAFSVLTVVPSRYLAPSRPGPLSRTSILLGAAWGLLVMAILVGMVEGPAWVVGSPFPPFSTWELLGG